MDEHELTEMLSETIDDLVLESASRSIGSGDVANRTVINSGGTLYVAGGAVANETQVSGWMAVLSLGGGGSANDTVVKEDGRINVGSGGVASSTLISGFNANFNLAEGARAADVTVAYGKTSDCGFVSSIVIAGNRAFLYVTDKGSAEAVEVRQGGRLFVSAGGGTLDTEVYSGSMTVGNGGSARSATVGAGGVMSLDSGAAADHISVLSGGGIFLSQGVVSADHIDILGGGRVGGFLLLKDTHILSVVNGSAYLDEQSWIIDSRLFVDSGGAVSLLTVTADGIMTVKSGGTAGDISVAGSGELRVSAGGRISGCLNIASGAVVSAYAGSEMDFSIAGILPGDTPRISDLSLVNGAPDYFVTVSAAQPEGRYILAGGVSSFTDTILVRTADETIGILSNGGSLKRGDHIYTLLCQGGELSLSVGVDGGTVPTVSVQADITSPTNRDVTVTATFSDDSAYRKYSLDGENWNDYTESIVFAANGTAYFRGISQSGRMSELVEYAVSNIDKTPPVITLSGDNVYPVRETVLTAVVDDGSAPYYRVDGSEWIAYTAPITVTANGVYDFRATDAAGNTGTASLTFANIVPAIPGDLHGTADSLSWSSTGAARYVVEYSQDDFAHAISVATAETGVDSFELPAGTYSWRVRSEDCDEWARGEDFVSEGSGTEAKVVSSDEDGIGDIFFVGAGGVWTAKYSARHVGAIGAWEGTGETVGLGGKNRICNFYAGSEDANILLLTDDANGDALFVDDVYTALPGSVAEQQSRIAEIDEIRAGAGDDVVDMTSRRFAYIGDGVTVRGGLGDDAIWANKGDNMLFGDAGNDRLIGASGNDVIVGGTGNDSMHGGGGNDIFTFGANWGADKVEQLADGTVTLWFASGDAAGWDAATLTYTYGGDSVTVTGVSADQIALKFGDDGSEQYAALAERCAFADFSSERIFEEKDKGALVCL